MEVLADLDAVHLDVVRDRDEEVLAAVDHTGLDESGVLRLHIELHRERLHHQVFLTLHIFCEQRSRVVADCFIIDALELMELLVVCAVSGEELLHLVLIEGDLIVGFLILLVLLDHLLQVFVDVSDGLEGTVAGEGRLDDLTEDVLLVLLGTAELGAEYVDGDLLVALRRAGARPGRWSRG